MTATPGASPVLIGGATAVLTVADVAVRLAVAPGSVHRYRHRDETFPAPSGHLGRTPYWLPEVIDAWVNSRPRSRGSLR